jgi:NADPH2:quinone reductase
MPRAVVAHKFAPFPELRLEDVPQQALREGEVRVAVHAAGLNFPDILMVDGKYQLKPLLPFTPGVEAAGVVAEIGPGAAAVAPGDRVIARMRWGAFADEVMLPPAQLSPLPPGYGFAEGASLLVAANTAHHALVQRAALRRSETLLVLGAAGGVGLAAVEIGRHLGAVVIACASSEEKREVCRARGADHVIGYEGLRESVRGLTGGAGADVVFDPVGGDAFAEALRATAWQGRYLVIGFAGGSIPSVAVNRILLKGVSLIGVRAGEAARQDPGGGRANLEAVLTLAAGGLLRPHISHRLPLERFVEGMQILAERRAIGRIVLTMRES